MKRRELITLLGGAAAWPLAARAQQPVMPVVGFLHSASPEQVRYQVAAFRRGLNQAGYVEGRNVMIEYRWAEGFNDRLPALTIDLVSRRVAVIFAGGNAAAQVAKPASNSVPIVFAIGADPVELGLVQSINRPGGNITGVSFLSTALTAKSLEILHEAVPNKVVIAAVVNPTNPNAKLNTRELQEAARILGLQLHVLNVSSERDIDAAFATLVQQNVGALLIDGDPFFEGRLDQLVAQLARHPMPAIYQNRRFADAGGLMSYGTSVVDAYRIAGDYTGRILNGEKPTELPVQQSTKVELILNSKAAKALGLTFPLSLLGRADQVIE
jgi:putative ABC transport system substrate-binding protein